MHSNNNNDNNNNNKQKQTASTDYVNNSMRQGNTSYKQTQH
jgi:hypothetical protein